MSFKREGRSILEDVNLTVKEGEHWVILGRNGSGKTTILEMLNGYQFPTSGEVNVLGNLYGTVDLRDVRKDIGYISQSLFEKLTPRDPVWEVVATGEYAFLRFYQDIPQEVIDKAYRMLERVQMSHVADQLLGSLSQGERKKVMLARSLMQNPKLLIMDEPCSGLDLFERERLLENINDLADQNLTIVYVTHHIEELIPIFTHVALLHDGKIVAAGKKEEVLSAENLVKTFAVDVSVEWYNNRPWVKVNS